MLALAATVLVAAASLLFVAPAGAQANCAASPGYNPSATFGVSPASVPAGGSVVFSGSGWAPGCTLTVTVGGQTITVTTDATGSFSSTFSTTGLNLGSYVATATQGTLSLTTSFNVVGAAVVPLAPVTPTRTGSLPVTGSSNTTLMVQGGLGLLAIGGLLVIFARKRRGAPLAG